jgi:hypothetical protein
MGKIHSQGKSPTVQMLHVHVKKCLKQMTARTEDTFSVKLQSRKWSEWGNVSKISRKNESTCVQLKKVIIWSSNNLKCSKAQIDANML